VKQASATLFDFWLCGRSLVGQTCLHLYLQLRKKFILSVFPSSMSDADLSSSDMEEDAIFSSTSSAAGDGMDAAAHALNSLYRSQYNARTLNVEAVADSQSQSVSAEQGYHLP
jgi:hypothetical protein